MFLFSKKFLSLLVVMTLMIGGEHRSAEGQFKLERCFECTGDGADIKSPVCNANQDGIIRKCPYYGACAMIKEGDKISKTCEYDASEWSEDGQIGGKPKCIKNKKCYCNDDNNCNKKKDFGLEPVEPGSVGTKVIGPATYVLSMMVAAWMYYYITSN